MANTTDMPNRILREGILTSPRMARLSWAAEVFYRRLHSVVDDFGRFHAHPMLLRAACYPLQLDKVSDSDIGKWMLETAEAGLVRVFEHADQRYLELLDFRQQVRATKSKFPEPPDAAQHPHSICAADAHQARTKTETNPKSNTRDEAARQSRGQRLPQDWLLPKAWGEWAIKEQPTWTPDHTRKVAEKFKDHWIAQSGQKGVKADWDATWRNWVRNEGAMRANGAGGSGSGGAPWWSSNEGILAKGRERGMEPRKGESFPDFKARINADIEQQGASH